MRQSSESCGSRGANSMVNLPSTSAIRPSRASTSAANAGSSWASSRAACRSQQLVVLVQPFTTGVNSA